MSSTITVPPNLAALLTAAINAAIQSPAIQGLTFEITPGCKASVLNNMYFCDAASATGSETVIPHGDTATPHGDTDTPHGDGTTIPHGDAKTGHTDATVIPHGDTKVIGIHTDTPKVHTDIPSIHTDTPAVHTDVPKIHTDVPAVHIDTPASDLTYGVGLSQLTGAGSLRVQGITISATTIPDPPPPDYSFAFAGGQLSCGTLTATGYAKVQETPLPAINITPSQSVNNMTGTCSGEITLYCSGNSDGRTPGYYANITTLAVTFPTDADSYAGLGKVINELSSLGYATAWVEPAFNEVLAEVTSEINGPVSDAVKDALNGILEDTLLVACDC
jgi:hypothetical protein